MNAPSGGVMRTSRTRYTPIVTSESLRTDQGDHQVDQQPDRDDQLEDVGERHTRSSHAAKRAARTKNPTIRTTISTSVTSSPPPATLGAACEGAVKTGPSRVLVP